jgi:hypothetical protein
MKMSFVNWIGAFADYKTILLFLQRFQYTSTTEVLTGASVEQRINNICTLFDILKAWLISLSNLHIKYSVLWPKYLLCYITWVYLWYTHTFNSQSKHILSWLLCYQWLLITLWEMTYLLFTKTTRKCSIPYNAFKNTNHG